MRYPTKQAHWVKDTSTILEELRHGAILTKFIAVDRGDTDISVEIHGFVTESGTLIITNEKFNIREEEVQNG